MLKHDELIDVIQHSLVLQEVKREAKRRIEVVAPLWKQCNALADLVQLQNKKELSDDEQSRLPFKHNNCLIRLIRFASGLMSSRMRC